MKIVDTTEIQRVNNIAQRVTPSISWDDLTLPQTQLSQLRDICDRAKQKNRMCRDWSTDQRCIYGKQLKVIFSGPSGSDKSYAAEVIAGELKMDLYTIDLSGIVSKYIGETNKNLENIFKHAGNAILFFDEADALFGKRTDVTDAHDRFSNTEVSYLLQKIEQFDGVVILASNISKSLDEAFIRRMEIVVEFPSVEKERWKILWNMMLRGLKKFLKKS